MPICKDCLYFHKYWSFDFWFLALILKVVFVFWTLDRLMSLVYWLKDCVSILPCLPILWLMCNQWVFSVSCNFLVSLWGESFGTSSLFVCDNVLTLGTAILSLPNNTLSPRLTCYHHQLRKATSYHPLPSWEDFIHLFLPVNSVWTMPLYSPPSLPQIGSNTP